MVISPSLECNFESTIIRTRILQYRKDCIATNHCLCVGFRGGQVVLRLTNKTSKQRMKKFQEFIQTHACGHLLIG